MAKTLEEIKEEQAQRAKDYGIGVKENYGFLEKPKIYEEIEDADFADPVNYQYPVDTKPNTMASMRTFGLWDNIYSQSEKQIILSRIYAAIDKFKIDLKNMYFAEADNTNVSDSDEWIDLFKIGKQTDSSGDTKEWTSKDLDTIVEKYNNQDEESKHRAPAIAGEHLDDKSLVAYGWVKELKVENGHLFGKFEKIDNDFKTMVNDGKFNTVSIALYPDLLLQHVAFLGAKPPAVKGLKAPQFSKENEKPILLTYSAKEKKNNINYEGTGKMTLDEYIKAVVDAIKVSDGEEVASNVRAEMEKLKSSVSLAAPATDKTPKPTEEPKAKFSESPEFIALSQEVKAEKEKRIKIELDLQAERDGKFFTEVIRHGVMLPTQITKAEKVLQVIREPKSNYQFSENGTTITATGEEVFKDFVNSYPKIIEFGEYATSEKAAQTQTESEKKKAVREQIRNEQSNRR